MTLSAEYLLLGAAVIGGAGLMLDEAKQSVKQVGKDFDERVRHVRQLHEMPKAKSKVEDSPRFVPPVLEVDYTP